MIHHKAMITSEKMCLFEHPVLKPELSKKSFLQVFPKFLYCLCLLSSGFSEKATYPITQPSNYITT